MFSLSLSVVQPHCEFEPSRVRRCHATFQLPGLFYTQFHGSADFLANAGAPQGKCPPARDRRVRGGPCCAGPIHTGLRCWSAQGTSTMAAVAVRRRLASLPVMTTLLLVATALAGTASSTADQSTVRRCGSALLEFMDIVCDGLIYDPYEATRPKRGLLGMCLIEQARIGCTPERLKGPWRLCPFSKN